MQNYIGQQIDRYRITERLGMGGMAVVYKAYDTRLERDVALKLIRVDEIPPSQHERLMKRFEREAKAMARFSHPNIVPVHDYGEVDGTPYLVMEYIPGGTLKERINQPIPYQQAVRWLAPIADALRYAHERNIFHRDVKPSNVLFDSEDRPMLTDFGIAKVLETDEATLTGTGLGVGTPEYMAPEQWQGETCPATDQYALGVVLYELITGRKPYLADTPAAIILMQATEPLQAPSNLVSGIPESVEKVLYKALARDPQDRYENMDEFTFALRRLLVEADTAEPIPTQPKDPEPEPAPAGQAANVSESVTRDALDATPPEGIPQTQKSGKMKRKALPKWLFWAIGGIIGLVLITLASNLGSRSANISNDNDRQVSSIVTETDAAVSAPTNTSAPIKTATITPTPEPALGIGSTMINAKDGAEMVYVPAGEFLMGSEDADAYDDETPEHTVYLDAYWIYKHEVTNAQYRQCIEDGVCSGDLSSYPENNFPAVYINWSEATDYCQWAGGRLPTEAEWEKAARGTDARKYPWGDAYPNCDLVNYGGIFGGCAGGIAEVCSFSADISPYGAMDMAGNVSEWTANWYDSNYYANSSYLNPTGPDNGENRVIRGGNYFSTASDGRVRITERKILFSGMEGLVGFRCVYSP